MLFFTHALISLSWAWLFQIYWSELYPCRYGLISRLLISRISRYICWRFICVLIYLVPWPLSFILRRLLSNVAMWFRGHLPTLTTRVYKTFISTAWLVAVIMVALSQMQTSITLKRAYAVFVFTVSFVLPNILILAMYTKIFRITSSLVRRTPAWTRQKPLGAKFVRSEKLLWPSAF